jgi:hypothetical protein
LGASNPSSNLGIPKVWCEAKIPVPRKILVRGAEHVDWVRFPALRHKIGTVREVY